MPAGIPPVHDPEFHRLMTRALDLEWELAVAALPARVRPLVRRPGFAISATTRLLGQWVPAPVREIRLSAACVLEHPWYAVVDVLRHETAHQLADELFGETEPPHGPCFRDLCRALRANPQASGDYPTLDEAVLTDRGQPEGSVMARVRKLMALAESPNRHEAERALAKARELMARHALEDPRQAPDPGFASIVLGEPALRHGLEIQALATLIREHCGVRTIWIPMVVPRAGKMGRALEISGTRAHVQLAHYTFETIRRVIVSEWHTFRRGRALGAHGQRDFALGMVAGFRTLLDAQVRASPSVQALVLARDAALDAYFEERYPRRRSGRAGAGVRVNGALRQAGEARAHQVGLRRGVTATPGKPEPPRLLEA